MSRVGNNPLSMLVCESHAHFDDVFLPFFVTASRSLLQLRFKCYDWQEWTVRRSAVGRLPILREWLVDFPQQFDLTTYAVAFPAMTVQGSEVGSDDPVVFLRVTIRIATSVLVRIEWEMADSFRHEDFYPGQILFLLPFSSHVSLDVYDMSPTSSQ